MQDYAENDKMITAHLADDYDKYLGAIVPPVFMNSLHVFPTIESYFDPPAGSFIYGRYGNPTVDMAERKLAALERGTRAFFYASGMAAASAAVMATCRAGSHVICVHNAYGPLQHFLKDYCQPVLNMSVTFVRGDHFDEIEAAVRENTALIVLESPGTATFSLVDLERVAKLAKPRGIRTYIDNTYCTPIFQKPLTMGIDIVMHTATKYLGGHSDVIAGALVVQDEELSERLRVQRPLFGGILGPAEAWLVIRGMRTLEARLCQHEKSAMAMAEMLEKHPRVKKVYYPGLPSHPQYELAKKQQTGNCGLLSFEVDGSLQEAMKVIDAMRIFKIGPSWGGFESLVVLPLYSDTDEYAEWYGASRALIRIHCGLEGTDVLLDDISRALQTL